MVTAPDDMRSHDSAPSPRDGRRIAIWLFFMTALVALMVLVGGATRLTDSGLSITEWKPVTGAIPPLSAADWSAEFEKYKTIPEYELVNSGMSLGEFKQIYWWEWGHRFLGRLIGIAFFVPMVFFLATRAARGGLAARLIAFFLLGGAQGALGWWMVSSGLTERVDVSQYRLAAHLSLAVLLGALMFWTGLSLWQGKHADGSEQLRALQLPAFGLVGLISLQIFLGAFVAGLRAGRTYNTWPLMNGKFFPDGYFYQSPSFNDLFETIEAVQFNHRIGAYLVAAGAVAFWWRARNTAIGRASAVLLVGVLFQIMLGIWTLLAATPISLGLAHQAGALFVLGAALYVAHQTTELRKAPHLAK